MKRQQFEELLFSGRKRTRREERDLQIYLQEHPEAEVLQANWREIEAALSAPKHLAPEKGFAERWELRWQQELERKQRRQSLWLVFFSALAALILLTFYIDPTQPLLTMLKDFFIASLNQVLDVFSFFQVTGRVALSLLQKFPPAWWASIAVALVLLPVLWFIVYRELAMSKGAAS